LQSGLIFPSLFQLPCAGAEKRATLFCILASILSASRWLPSIFGASQHLTVFRTSSSRVGSSIRCEYDGFRGLGPFGLAINVLFFCSLLLVLNGSERTALVGCWSLAHTGPRKQEFCSRRHMFWFRHGFSFSFVFPSSPLVLQTHCIFVSSFVCLCVWAKTTARIECQVTSSLYTPYTPFSFLPSPKTITKDGNGKCKNLRLILDRLPKIEQSVQKRTATYEFLSV